MIADGCPEGHSGSVAYADNASVPAPQPPSQFAECVYAEVGARQTTDWIDVGRMMDTLDHSNWNLPIGNYSVQLGVKGSDGTIQPLAAVYNANPANATCDSAAACKKLGAATSILIDPSTRATQRTRDISAAFWVVYENLSATPVHGRPPKHVLVTANTFPRGWPRSLGSTGTNVVE